MSIKNILASALAAAGILFGSYQMGQYIRMPYEILRLASDQFASTSNYENLKKATKLLDKTGHKSAYISRQSNQIVLGKGRERLGDRIDMIIYSSDAPELKKHLRSPWMEQFVRSYAKHIVFMPDVKSQSAFATSGDLDGLFVGEGVVLVDTLADDNRLRNPKTYASTIMHESTHSRDSPVLGKPKLWRERNAYTIQLEALADQLKTNPSNEVILAQYESIGRIVKTANFLLDLGAEFENVYPSETITSRGLLRGKVNPLTVNRYAQAKIGSQEDKMDELIIASSIADIVNTSSRDHAVNYHGFRLSGSTRGVTGGF